METFYEQLLVNTDDQRDYLKLLRELTRVSLAELRVVKIDYLWELWA